MSACNGYAVPVSERRTFFADVAVRFPDVDDDGKINTIQFLEASKTVVKMFDFFGRSTIPVKYDVNGNIEKLEKKFNINPDRFLKLNDMIKYEMENDNAKVAIDGLLWLKRALELTSVMLRCIVDDHKAGIKTENIVPFWIHAYEKTLKRYHGWAVQKLFSISLRGVPWRRDILKSMAHNREGMEDVVIIDMEEFLNTMDGNLVVIVKMYDDWGLNSDAKV